VGSGQAIEISHPASPTEAEPIEVAWIGERPPWVDGDAAAALSPISVVSAITDRTRVVHLACPSAETVAAVRSSTAAAVVVEIGQAASASAALLAEAADADVVVVESGLDGEELAARERRLAGKVRIVPAPVDLDRFAPEPVLTRVRGAYIKRFRRLHRLAHPSILFVGPYTRAGGLDVALAAAYRLRDRLPELRLAAIPVGGVDQRYLDQCEMDALALGHRGIIEWSASEDELPFWYATATVVCCPWREAAEARAGDITVRAAAAGRPFLGVDLPAFRHSFRASGSPELVRPGDAGLLVDALAPLLTSLPLADDLGARARSEAEAECSAAAAAAGLGAIWNGVATRRGV